MPNLTNKRRSTELKVKIFGIFYRCTDFFKFCFFERRVNLVLGRYEYESWRYIFTVFEHFLKLKFNARLVYRNKWWRKSDKSIYRTTGCPAKWMTKSKEDTLANIRRSRQDYTCIWLSVYICKYYTAIYVHISTNKSNVHNRV